MAFTAAAAYSTAFTATFLLYPYRDLVKGFDGRAPLNNVNGTFITSRYMGLMQNPAQPLLLALPTTASLVGSCYGMSGALCGGFVDGVLRNGLRVYSRDMSAGKKAPPLTIFSLGAGAVSGGTISLLTNGLALMSISDKRERRYQQHSSALWTCWSVFRAHAFYTFITSPLTTSLRSARYVSRRTTGTGVKEWVSGEQAVFKEALAVGTRIVREEGIVSLFGGTLRRTFKVSLPFAATVSAFIHLFPVIS